MATFQAKIGLNRLKKRENKKLSFRFVPTQGIRDNSKKIVKNSKNKNTPLWLLFKPKQVRKCRERDKIKISFPFRSYPTRNRKFQKKRKNFKKPLWLHFKPKQVGKG